MESRKKTEPQTELVIFFLQYLIWVFSTVLIAVMAIQTLCGSWHGCCINTAVILKLIIRLPRFSPSPLLHSKSSIFIFNKLSKMNYFFLSVSVLLASQCLAAFVPNNPVAAMGAYHPMSLGGHAQMNEVVPQVHTSSISHAQPVAHEHAGVPNMAPANWGVMHKSANLEGNHECTPWWGSYTFWGWTRVTIHCYGAKTCDVSIVAGITGKERFSVEPGQLKTIERQWAGGLYQVCNTGYSAFSVVTNWSRVWFSWSSEIRSSLLPVIIEFE